MMTPSDKYLSKMKSALEANEMTKPTPADNALSALDKLRQAAMGYVKMMSNGDAWKLDEQIRAYITSTLSRIEELEQMRDINGFITIYRTSTAGQGGDGWQTMDSAPKDGTYIIVYRPKSNGDYIPKVGVDYYNKKYNHGDGAWMKSNKTCGPTRWMPLPLPPAPKSGVTEAINKDGSPFCEKHGVPHLKSDNGCSKCDKTTQPHPPQPDTVTIPHAGAGWICPHCKTAYNPKKIRCECQDSLKGRIKC